MTSLYDELAEKLRRDPRLLKRGGARYDLGMMLFDERESLHELWLAAEACVRAHEGEEDVAELRAAVDRLRALFGERTA